ncbi:pilin [Microbulbifer spongiae]|uniref:pilin n=1 Tax=Microbulbifer spongiae TaxID=2944933 RepID=UPI00345E78BA
MPIIDVASASGLARACSQEAADPGDPSSGTPPTPSKPAGGLYGYNLTGKYVSCTQATAQGTDSCEIRATFVTEGVNDKIAGKHITLTYTVSNGNWVCTLDLEDSVLPKSCSNAWQ